MHPDHTQGKHSMEKQIGKEIQGFYQLADGY